MAKRTSTRFIARMIEGSKPSEMPGFIRPQLAVSRDRPPKGNWLIEIKLDGYRIQAHLNKGRATLYTRSGLDWTKRLRPIADAFDIPIDGAIFDGELVVIKGNRADFSELQADLANSRKDRLSYYIFDLLYLEGFDLRDSPLSERKRVLEMLFKETKLASPVFYCEHFEADGREMFERASELGLEGIVSKKPNAPYRSDRTTDWIKVKCLQHGRFPIVGFIPEIGGISALHLARREGKQLVYVGKVGTGFNRKTSLEVRRKLDAIVAPQSKLAKHIRAPKTQWVEPKYSAEVDYRDITNEGLLRASSFKGLVRSG